MSEQVSQHNSTTSTPESLPQDVRPHGLAIAALVLGITALVSEWAPFWGVIIGATAVILGYFGLRKPASRGMAIAGIITGGLGALWSLIMTIFFIFAIVVGTGTVKSPEQVAQEANQALITSQKDFSQGQVAIFANLYSVRVNSVQRNYVPDSSSFPAAPQGKEYIVINLTVKNISPNSENIASSDFTLLDNGTSQSPSTVMVQPALPSDDIASGDSASGNVVYQIGQGDDGLKLQYTTSVNSASGTTVPLVYSLAI